jgi:cytochrome c oxidase assembly factor CtaG
MIAAPIVAGVVAAWYLRLALRAAWPRWRTGCFLAGTTAVALAPLAGGALAAHMVEHAVLVAVAAPLLVLGAPVLLIALGLGPAGRRRLIAALRRRPLAALGWPPLAWSQFVAIQWVAHLPGAIAAVDGSPLAHVAEHAVLLASAIVFWLPVLGVGPRPARADRPGRRLDGGERALYLFLAAPALDLIAVMLMASGHPGAGVAMLAGMLPIGLAAVYTTWRWAGREERTAVAIDRVEVWRGAR